MSQTTANKSQVRNMDRVDTTSVFICTHTHAIKDAPAHLRIERFQKVCPLCLGLVAAAAVRKNKKVLWGDSHAGYTRLVSRACVRSGHLLNTFARLRVRMTFERCCVRDGSAKLTDPILYLLGARFLKGGLL